MEKPLYIVWKPEFEQGIAIIDEQHRGILATINSLNYFLQEGAEIKQLLPTIKILINYLMFHYKTEEGILRASEYPNLDGYKEKTSRRMGDFKDACEQAIKQSDPQVLLQFIGHWWQKHLEHHSVFSSYLGDWQGEYCRVDTPEDKH